MIWLKNLILSNSKKSKSLPLDSVIVVNCADEAGGFTAGSVYVVYASGNWRTKASYPELLKPVGKQIL
ncbi:hypothetical protein A3D05_00500 [Candidatus Gottesmanbacteria bacterium RIFCSPHIGHO2_02_FULL_40_24]|uniref:Uncharacterized protein n=1 Tax=Candidatus Gottesmanbacteria bacterium RIFCSPHIGHO2_01_FULL_40_15 TaxID=1798376 RepID=A0A1F5Z6J5_9BACT|nr:MAG: hypothetical protein A2777_01490 [Candidatus Gottesmanbacteria bacterium RIFCSPHIGHO2_01_FULL_40_15]OGG18225.1 MAG: hypothetical protein A3D05_00500 [Candidatus Gottesmanbacteria bacterium RIFCSPHIGHO2_02_FULL_40_24]OGG22893.1 MAG: hypothetical protein A3B48_01065 [Candidatus Gottesmanbacteria bacterium RIFCSPLOWO2_01_FULL_40_10]OGG23509.1 MAG: hypothetical protein A3E42_00580 [Candidatus Gottesmanbacteria bacterium RIFCSPHIGHO2_12_FULL_40_13]OGG32491.1 MAG: hypothetical protein A3I80_0